MKKATTVKGGSCSRPARPRKALGACAQVSPSSTVSPKWEEDKVNVVSFAALRILVLDGFKQGMSVYQVATKYGRDLATIEDVLRRELKRRS